MFKRVFLSVILVGLAGMVYAQCPGNCCNWSGYRGYAANQNQNSGYNYAGWNYRWSYAPVNQADKTEETPKPEEVKPEEVDPTANQLEEVPFDEVSEACAPVKACAPCQAVELPEEETPAEIPANDSLVNVPSSLENEPIPIPTDIPVLNDDGTVEISQPVYEVEVKPFCVRVIELINNFRQARGLPALQMDETMCANCESHSTWMTRYGFQHAYGAGMECIAMGVNTPESLVNMWMGSPAHAGILMSPGCRFIGIGSCNVYHTARVK